MTRSEKVSWGVCLLPVRWCAVSVYSAILHTLSDRWVCAKNSPHHFPTVAMAAKGGLIDGDALRIVLLGKTGAGKSTLGNALTGLKPLKSTPFKRDEKPWENRDPTTGFKVGKGLGAETRFSDWRRAERMGLVVEVTDTPGLCDTHLPEKDIYTEVAKSVVVAGPLIIMFVVRCDRRFTEEEYDAYKKVKQLFGDEMNKYLILVFAGMDAYEDDAETIDEQRETLKKEIEKYGPPLTEMIQDAGNKYMGMNLKAKDEDIERQVQDLLNMMQVCYAENLGRHFPAAKRGLADEGVLRVVLMGKTGAGKSSLGNALTNGCFKVGKGLRSETRYCSWNRVERMGMMVEVTDTPGLCDTHLPEELIHREVAKSVAVANPGPNVIVFVLRCDRRFTEEEYSAYKKIKQLFSDELNKYLILVFNGMDTFGENGESIDEQRETLKEEVEGYGPPLTEMMTEAGNRYFGMNGKAKGPDMERQVRDLLKQMKMLANTKGQYYKTKMMEQINAKVDELVAGKAIEKHVSKQDAVVQVKRDVVTEQVDPGAWNSIVDTVSSTASAVVGGVSDACSVM